MLKNYLKVALRSMMKNPTQSIVTISGLALGMAIFLMIMVYSLNELGYDSFHPRHENIYQLGIGDEFYTAAPLGTMLKGSVPEIETVVRMDHEMGGGQSPTIEWRADGGTQKMKVKDVLFADPNFFDVFHFPIVYGDRATALNEPNSIVMTRTTARSLFGAENAVGRIIHYIGDRDGLPRMDMTVTAVVEDVPNNSSLSFNAVGSLSTLNFIGQRYGYSIDNDWGNLMYSTFVVYRGHDVRSLTDKVNALWMDVEKRRGNSHEEMSLIPLDEVHFHNNSRRQLIFLLQFIGMFILAIAIINYINLTIAKSVTRVREIGIRRVVGSNRSELIRQFLGESILISLIAVPAAVVIVELGKPLFFALIDRQISFDVLYRPVSIAMFIAGIILIGGISGLYPAIVLSAYKPVSILKGEMTKGKRGNTLRYSLIVVQFGVSISLIITAILVSNQVKFLKTKDLGFNDKNIIRFDQSLEVSRHYDVFKQKLLQNPDIKQVSRCNGGLAQDLVIGLSHSMNGVLKPYKATTVDPDFIPAMEITMVEGRPFSWDMPGDRDGMIVNETFAREFQLKPALGAEVDFLGRKQRVIGVMKDFHYTSFHQKVEPAAFVWLDWNSNVNVRISGNRTSGTIQYIGDVWNELSPGTPFEYEFLDKSYDKLYKSEERFQVLIDSFTAVAMMIACMGLFGLISHSIDRRLKEIGVRKVLGATVGSIVFMLTRDLLRWVVLANIFAWPIAWYVINRWLQDFAYRVSVTVWPFLSAGVLTLAIAFLTLSILAVKAATANPVDALRCE